MDCTSGKVRFATEAEARRRLGLIIQRSMNGERIRKYRGETAVYACGICYGWHLTSKPQSGEIVGLTA